MRKVIDFRAFCDEYRVEWVDEGKNVKKGHVNISCPFCNSTGNPDPSHHLGVNEEKGWFSCWRNKSQHSSNRLHKLIQKISGCSYEQACVLLNTRPFWYDETQWERIVKNPFEATSAIKKEVKKAIPLLRFPSNFKKISGKSYEQKFVNYLLDRGFTEDVFKQYSLYYCLLGDFSNRIIFPVVRDTRLVTWTGRSLSKTASLRYLSLSESEGAVFNIYECLWQYDDLLDSGGDILFVVEGPFDALKLDFYGKRFNCRSTCLFGLPSEDSKIIWLLKELFSAFSCVVFSLDPGQYSKMLRLKNQFPEFSSKIKIKMVQGAEDPGALSKNQVENWCKQLKNEFLGKKV